MEEIGTQAIRLRQAARARIAEIDAQLHLLQMERAVHQKQLDDYTYPVLSLPNEITSEIFIQCLPSYPACPPLKGPLSPTSLTHVCRQWRDIALATPQLWRAITFEAPGEDRTAWTWLERSGSCPLSINVSYQRYTGSLVDTALAAILLHRKQWEYAVLTIQGQQVALLQGPMPLLCELTLHAPDSFTESSRRPSANACDFPRLRTLSLSCFDDLGNWLPWSQLTSLTLMHTYSPTYLSTLRGAVNLVHLKLIYCVQDSHRQCPDVNLPRLETLIMVDPDGDFHQGLSVFTLPSLRSLQVPATFLNSDRIETFASLVSRSGCTELRKVLITGEFRLRISKRVFRRRFPAITFVFNSGYNWAKRRPGDEEDSGGSGSESE
ncbi:hypothetical protein FB45DRAFT_1070672 [Roridomyces roridus]|uniref:F-box domain-containing protein n=1 Tax=Roridomyces roridus TaxID=1738132 RepID=A0AAD7AYB1_9AGAR|nr:hypothetical protein FB45DRAFT_1070672 [Roridomyces roridus]